MAYLELPDDAKTLAAVLEEILKFGEKERNIHKVEWLVNHMYLKGVRDFRKLNWQAGTVEGRFESDKGEINYRFELVTRKFQTELGRLLRLDVTPALDLQGIFSLDGLRNASISQAVLNILHRQAKINTTKIPFLQALLTFGTAGLACWGQKSAATAFYQAVTEVVPPWELVPIPTRPAIRAQVEAIVRLRYLPMKWLREREGLKIPEKGVEIVEGKYGVPPEQALDAYGNFSGTTGGPGDKRTDESAIVTGRGRLAKKDFVVEYGKTAEVFIPEPDGTLARYIVWVGGTIVADVRFNKDKEPPMMPLGVARYIDTGDFYGRSFVSGILPTNMEVEYLLRRLFENAQDLDQFGYLMLPANMGIQVSQFKSTARPRTVMYEPDLTVPEHKPFNIQPTNTGDWPGKIANLGREIINEQSGQGEMFGGDAPGRVDSAAGMGFLQETASIPLSPTAESVAEAYSTLYRAMLGMAREQWTPETVAHLTCLDDSLVGIVLDPETGRISLDQNAIPHPSKVDVTIKAATPRSKHQRKMELMTMLQAGAVTMREFRRISRVEGLDFPLGARAEYENYRKAILHNIILFGDGKQPGKITMSAESDNPEIHLEVLNDFMSRPEFMLADKAVRNAFEGRKDIYERMLGQNMPPGMGYPEDEAAAQQIAGGVPEPEDLMEQGEPTRSY